MSDDENISIKLDDDSTDEDYKEVDKRSDREVRSDNDKRSDNEVTEANGVKKDSDDDTKSKKTRTKTVKVTKDTKATKTDSKDAKKGPGRPRKIPRNEPIPRRGIGEPSDKNHMVEMLYDMPITIKRIISFFKALSVARVQIIFRKTEIIMYAIDHQKKNRIYVRINGKNLNHYYCKNEFNIGLVESDLENVLNKIDKDCTSIIIISEVENYQKNIKIILENNMQIDETNTINLIGTYDLLKRDEVKDDEKEFLDDDYPIKFELPGKYFRKIISDVKTMSKTLSFIQNKKNEPLQFQHHSDGRKIETTYVSKDLKKIKFVSKLNDTQSFRATVNVEYLKPVSSGLIVDDVTIMVDEKKSFMTKSYIDNGTIEIRTLTEIVNNRQ